MSTPSLSSWIINLLRAVLLEVIKPEIEKNRNYLIELENQVEHHDGVVDSRFMEVNKRIDSLFLYIKEHTS